MNTGIFLADEAATLAAGALLARLSEGRGLFTLQGDLGSGKTTFSRGLIQALGHHGAVKSPTYTLVEPYELATGHVLHYDLYRLNDPEELHFLGVRDFLDADTLTLVEWPERGQHWLPQPDLALSLSVEANGRRLRWQPCTERGQQLSQQLEEQLSG
ncbi:MAG: tRNA (adenosine(37)-N6)-threonylcarbamoyltransferase complex ATPase subunit type 1 TsaE [Pseudomonadota bacterium]